MKSTLRKLSVMFLVLLLSVAVVPASVSAAKVKLSKAKLTLTVGQSAKLKLKNNKKKVKWSSSNRKIATVSSKGKVKARKQGTAKITATAGGKKYVCKLTVKPKVRKIKLNKTSISLDGKGRTFTLKATITPKKANKKLSWSSSDPAIATVSSKGKVTAVADGTVIITAAAKDGSKKKATCTVKVTGAGRPAQTDNEQGKPAQTEPATDKPGQTEPATEKAGAAISDVTLSNAYPQKGEQIQILMKIDSTVKEEPSSVTANKKEYSLQKQADGKYAAFYTVQEKAGREEIQIQSVQCAGQTFPVSCETLYVDVLKERPSIGDFSYDDSGAEPKLSAQVSDPDGAVTGGEVWLMEGVEKLGIDCPVTVSEPGSNGMRTIKIDITGLKEARKYELNLMVAYDLDGEGGSGQNEGKVMKSHCIERISEYNFSLTNLSLDEVDRTNRKLTFSFESSNASSVYSVAEVVVNEKTCSVVKGSRLSGEEEAAAVYRYSFTLPYSNEERTEYKLTQATLDSRRSFAVADAKALVFKDEPTAEDVTLELDGRQFVTAFQVTDPDDTLRALHASLIDWNGKTLETVDLEPSDDEAYTVKFDASCDGHAGTYRVELTADYDRADGQGLTKGNLLGEASAEILIKVDKAIASAGAAYVEKGGRVELSYEITDNVTYMVKNVEIAVEGEDTAAVYAVTDSQETAEGCSFTVRLAAPEKAGKLKYALKKIHYIDDQEGVDAEYTAEVSGCETEIEVLKSRPEIRNFLADRENGQLTFEVEDPDKAVSAVSVTAKADNGEAVVLETTGGNGTYIAALGDLAESDCEFSITLDYDLDMNPDDQENTGTAVLTKKINLSIAYRALMSDILVRQVNRISSTVAVEFTAVVTANNAETDEVAVERVLVGDAIYDVTKNAAGKAGTYWVELPYSGEDTQTVTIDALVLDNGEKFDCTDNNTVSIFLAEPKAGDLTLSRSEDVISASLKLEDSAKVLSELTAVLQDASGAEVAAVEILDQVKEDDAEGTISVSFGEYRATMAGGYTVVVLGTYNRHDGLTHDKETLASQTLEIPVAAKVESGSVPAYVEKSAEIELAYRLTDNTDLQLTALVINDKEYPATASEGEEDSYTVQLTAPETAGQADYVLTRACYASDMTAELENTLTTEVLKSEPSIVEYKVDPESREISFQLKDEDGAFIDGALYAVGTDKSERKIYDIEEAGEHSFALPADLEEDAGYQVEFRLTFDRKQTKQESGEYFCKDKVVRTEKLEFQAEDVTLSDIRVAKVDKDGNTVSISFRSNGDERHRVATVVIQDKEYRAEYDEETEVYTVSDIVYTDDDNVRQTYAITKFALETGVEVEAGEGEFGFTIFENPPVVEDLQVEVQEADVEISFRVADEAKTASKLYVALRREIFNEVYGNYETNIMDSQEITELDGAYELTLKVNDLENSYDFYVDVAADYEAADGETHEEERLTSQTASIKISAEILSDSITNPEEDLGGDEIDEIVEKKQLIRVAFEVKDNTDYDVASMEINNRVYAANKDRPTDDGTIYLVDVEAPEIAGAQKLNVTKLYYGNGTKDADVDYSTDALYIRRTLPQFANYDDQGTAAEPYLAFTFTDPDHTLQGSTATFKILNAAEEVVCEETLTPEQEYHIDLSNEEKYPDGIYTLKAEASCINDETGKAEPRDLMQDDILHLNKRLQILRGYNYKAKILPMEMAGIDGMPYYCFFLDMETLNSENKITGFRLLKLRQKEDGSFEQEEYSTEKNPDSAQIYGYDEDYCGFIYDWTYEKGITYIYFESFILEDNTELIVDSYSNYALMNREPSMSGIKLKEDVINDTVTATGRLTDESDTLNRLQFRLKAANGRVLCDRFLNREEIQSQMEQNDGQINVEFDKNMPLTSRYNLDVIAEYDLEGRGTFRKITLGNTSLNAAERVVIRNHHADNPYPKKSDEVTLEYQIAHNLSAGIEIVGMVINGEEVELSSSKDDLYCFKVAAPTYSGKYDYTATAVMLSNKQYKLEKKENEAGEVEYNLQPTDTVDVLKDVPYVSGYTMEESFADKEASFEVTLVDPDHALIEGTEGVAKVGEEEQRLEAGTTTVTFGNLQIGQELQLDIIGNYDLDSDPGNGENAYRRSLLAEEEPVPFMLLDDYGLRISDLKVCDTAGGEAVCLEKGAPIDLSFRAENKASQDIEQIEVHNNSYDVTKQEDGSYTARINGFTEAGETTVAIQNVTLSSGKELATSEKDDTATVEILKDAVSVEKFRHTNGENSMTLTIGVRDDDQSLTGNTLNVTVTDMKTQEAVVSHRAIEAKAGNVVTFSTAGDGRKYEVSIAADYQRDAAGEYAQKNAEIYHKTVSMDDRGIEMKEILDVTLYRLENGVRVEVNEVDRDDFAANYKKSYIARVDMANLPSFYSAIEDYTLNEEENKLILKISYEGLVSYSGEEGSSEYLEIEYDLRQEGGFAYSGSFESLIRKMQANPGGSLSLDKDYDASTFSPDTITYFGDGAFTGTLDGNGHTISNLSKPLFDKLESAKIRNLYITDVTLASADGARAVLAHTTKKTTITNVHIDRAALSSAGSGTSGYGAFGGLVAEASENTVISQCSVQNLTLSQIYLTQLTGAIARDLKNSTVRDCYAEGVTLAGWWGNGGLVGRADANSTVENCISNHSVSASYDYDSNANIVGQSNGTTLRNNISLAARNSGHTRKISGGSIGANSSNNYQLSDVTGVNVAGAETISSDELSEEFYRDQLGLDPVIWDLSGASKDKVPTLKGNRMNAPYVPGYDRLKDSIKYQADKEIAYNNLYKLTPFYDASYILADAVKINTGDRLNRQKLNGVIPYNAQGDVVYALDTKNYKTITRIKFVYDDLSMEEHPVSFDTYFGNVACYDITDLGLKYTFNHYVINASSPLVDELVSYLKSQGNYAKGLDPLTTAKDGNTYRHYYDEILCTDENLREFVVKVLANCDYAVTGDDTAVNTVIRDDLIGNNRLKELLYTYNYFKRWYDFDIGEFNIADMTMFKGDIFNDRLGLNVLTTALLSNPSSTMRPSATQEFYSGYIGTYTGFAQLPDYLNYFIKACGKYENVNDWFTQNFSGYLIELEMDKIPGLDIEYEKLKYRAWEHLRVRSNLILPLLTVPERSTYIISYPTTIAFGAIRTYIRDPFDDEQYQSFKNSADGWAAVLKRYYNMYLGILSGNDTDVVALLNSKDDVAHDNTAIYETPNAAGRVWADVAKTDEPYFKWFAEPTGNYYYHDANYAVANGWKISYAQGNFFGNMLLYSHEAAHNQDGSIFFKGLGRRAGANAESYTTSFFTQSFPEGSPQINGTYVRSDTTDAPNNLTPERINTADKINDYYKKMFDTSFFLDYLMGEAFLQLTPEQQAKVVSRYADNGKSGQSVTAADIENMHLKTVDDLVKNGLCLYTNVNQSLYNVRWYEPHSTTSIVSDEIFHYLAYEMLGYAGYDKGYIRYAGNVFKNDVDAIQRISADMGDNYQSYEDYKIGQFNKLAQKKDQLSYVDADAVIEEFRTALEADAALLAGRSVPNARAAKEKYYLLLKRNTDDFRGEVFQGRKESDVEVHVKTAEDFVKAVTANKYARIIVDADLDFAEYTSGSAICGVTFLGSVNGNGKAFVNLRIPVFKTLSGITVEKLTLRDAELNTSYDMSGILARSMENCLIQEVRIESSEITANSKSRIGGLSGYAAGTTFKNVSVDGLTINNGKEAGAVAGYMTASTVTGGSVKNITVTGNLDSVGGLAGQAVDSMILESVGEGINLSGRTNVGGLVGYLSGTQTVQPDGALSCGTVKNCRTRNVVIAANTKAGGLVGYAEKGSRIAESSTADVTAMTALDSAGGLIGELYDSAVTDSYAARVSVTGRSYIGGFAGYTQNAVFTNCYAHGEASCSVSSAGGFVGTVRNSDSTASVKNNLALVKVADKQSKFDPSSAVAFINSNFANNYEIVEYPGIPSQNRGIAEAAVKAIGINSLSDESFYTGSMAWNSSVWDFSCVVSGGLPMLQGAGNALAPEENAGLVTAGEETIAMDDDPSGAMVIDLEEDEAESEMNTEAGSEVNFETETEAVVWEEPESETESFVWEEPESETEIFVWEEPEPETETATDAVEGAEPETDEVFEIEIDMSDNAADENRPDSGTSGPQTEMSEDIVDFGMEAGLSAETADFGTEDAWAAELP